MHDDEETVAQLGDWLTVKQAAERLAVSRRWLTYRLADGSIPSVRLGGLRRIDADHLDHLLSSGALASRPLPSTTTK